MGCAGSVAEHKPLELVQRINTGVLAKHGSIGRLTIIDSKTALLVGPYGVCVLDISDPNSAPRRARVQTAVCSLETPNRITPIPNSPLAEGRRRRRKLASSSAR